MKIQIVEDELVLQELYRVLIQKYGHQVTDSVETEENAVIVARENPADLIFMDIFLENGGNGIAAAEKIREFSNVPILFITANQDEDLIERAKKVSTSEYFSKPVRPALLKTVIARYAGTLP